MIEVLVRDIMKSPVIAVEPDASLSSVYSLMHERGIRHVPVVRRGVLVGVVTDRDLRLATSALAEKPFSPQAKVEKVMSQPVRTADPLDPVEEAARTMRQLKIGCLPVTSGGALAGIVTGVDLLDALLRLTGVSTGSSRLEVRLPDHPGELAHFTGLLAARQIDIRSVLSHADSPDGVRIVLRVATIDAKAIAQDLRAQGFEVLWPPQKPW